jgi:hypothetical protein
VTLPARLSPGQARTAIALAAVTVRARRRLAVLHPLGAPHPLPDLTGAPLEVIVDAIVAAIAAAHAHEAVGEPASERLCQSCSATIDLAGMATLPGPSGRTRSVAPLQPRSTVSFGGETKCPSGSRGRHHGEMVRARTSPAGAARQASRAGVRGRSKICSATARLVQAIQSVCDQPRSATSVR